MNKIDFFIFSIITSLVMGCSHKNNDAPKENNIKTISVSIEPQRWILEQIGGDKLNVVSLLPGDANPENFDPPMSSLKSATESSLYMRMGNLPWEKSLIERITASNPEIKVIDTSEGISLIYGTHEHSHNHSHDNDGLDPHTWSSVKNAKIIASNMFNAIVETDSVNKEYYTCRFKILIHKLDSLDNEFTERLLPIKGKSILVWHPSLSYFARDYGINQISLGMENKETTPKGLQKQMEMAASHNPIAFFVEPQMAGTKSETVEEQSGAKRLVIQPLAYDWWNEMEKITNFLTETIN